MFSSDYLALQTYHRHYIPTPDMYVWDQFRKPDGTPIYPQRDVLLGPVGAFNAAGSHQTGQFDGKIIVVQTLMDMDSLPWQADWYRSRVEEALGSNLDDNHRLWFIDHAQHKTPEESDLIAQAHTVDYIGAIEQALRELSAWVEDGVPPPMSTTYEVIDGQVEVPETAAEHSGIQPVVTLSADGKERVEIAAGETVAFSAVIEVPPNTGKVVSAQWDFEGAGTDPVAAPLGNIDTSGNQVMLSATYAYSEPGTYFPVIRVASQREGDTETPYALVQNIGRMRVVVQ